MRRARGADVGHDVGHFGQKLVRCTGAQQMRRARFGHSPRAQTLECTQTLADAFAKGQLRIPDLKRVQIAGRALVYGFARMNIDGHFPRWGVAEAEAERTAEAILDVFIDGIARRPGVA